MVTISNVQRTRSTGLQSLRLVLSSSGSDLRLRSLVSLSLARSEWVRLYWHTSDTVHLTMYHHHPPPPQPLLLTHAHSSALL